MAILHVALIESAGQFCLHLITIHMNVTTIVMYLIILTVYLLICIGHATLTVLSLKGMHQTQTASKRHTSKSEKLLASRALLTIFLMILSFAILVVHVILDLAFSKLSNEIMELLQLLTLPVVSIFDCFLYSLTHPVFWSKS